MSTIPENTRCHLFLRSEILPAIFFILFHCKGYLEKLDFSIKFKVAQSHYMRIPDCTRGFFFIDSLLVSGPRLNSWNSSIPEHLAILEMEARKYKQAMACYLRKTLITQPSGCDTSNGRIRDAINCNFPMLTHKWSVNCW